MTLYVDPPTWPGHGRMWSHLVSDVSFDELHAFAREAGIVSAVSHPVKGTLKTIANPIRVDGERLSQEACSPLGADNKTYLV